MINDGGGGQCSVADMDMAVAVTVARKTDMDI